MNDLQLRYRRSVLGVGWSLLLPLCTSLVLGLVFHEIFQVSIGEFLPFLLSGLAVWAYLTAAAVEGCQSYVQAEHYIRQHPLPLAIYPLRTTLGALIHLNIALLLVYLFVQCGSGYENPLALLHLIPALALLFLCGWSTAILFGFFNTIFRDTQHILQVSFQILFYLTPVIYPARILMHSRLATLADFNPLVHFLNLIRHPLLLSSAPPAECYLWTVSVCGLLSIMALTTLRYQQKHLILHL